MRSLRWLTPRARAGAIGAALPVAGDDEVEGLADELLELLARRPDPVSMAAVAGEWVRLAEPARARFQAVSIGHLDTIAAILSEDPSAPRRRSLARLAAEIPDPSLAAHLAPLLRDGDYGVRESAGAALIDLAMRAGADGSTAWGEAAETAVAYAAAGYDAARAVATVIAMLRLLVRPTAPAPMGPLRGVIDDESLPIHSAVRQFIRRSSGVVGIGEAWRLLRYPSLAPACLDRIGRASAEMGPADGTASWSGALRHGHLIAHPHRLVGLRRLAARTGAEMLFGPMVGEAGRAGATIDERAAAAAFLHGACTRAADFDRLASRLLTDPSARVRHGLVRAGAARRPLVLPVLLDLCFDADPRCARGAVIAAALWQRTGRTPEPALDAAARGLRRSPHAAVRRIAQEIRIDGDDLFAGDARARLAAREMLRRDRGRVLSEVRGRLASGEGPAAVAAAGLAAQLGIVAEVEIELLALLQSVGNSGHAAASSAAALGHLATDSSFEALQALLAAPDLRVRANALDALVRRACRGTSGDAARSRVGTLAAGLAGAGHHHRVRAGALRAGFLLGQRGGDGAAGVAGLGAMLEDERPMHRIAGLWLAERVAPAGARDGWGEIACRVTGLYRDDAERAVRHRAGRCAAALLARFRSDWASRARGPLEPGVPAGAAS